MSGYDDDAREMGDSFGFDDGGARDAATGAAVAQFIDDLRSLGEADPPTPNAELAAVLQGAPVPRPVRTGSGRKRVVVAVAASLLVGGQAWPLRTDGFRSPRSGWCPTWSTTSPRSRSRPEPAGTNRPGRARRRPMTAWSCRCR